MAADGGWFAGWYDDDGFPPVWFAPADDSHLTPAERQPYLSAAHVALAPTATTRRRISQGRRYPLLDEAQQRTRRQADEEALLLIL